MKIIFICGSLEAGRDGVGDYTRKLASELVAQSNQVAIIALNDKYLKEDVLSSYQEEVSCQIHTLRLSPQLSWEKRTEKALEFVTSYDPDWISLQYVPYSFQMKGLPISIANVVKQVSFGRKTHIMFHELWVGMSIQSSKKDIFIGWIQRQLTKLLIDKLQPKVIHTQNILYQKYLQRIRVKALHLPLFSNIPVTSNNANQKQTLFESENKINFVFFGGVHPGAPVDQLAREVATYAAEKKIDIELRFVGRSGKEQETWAKAWRSQGLNVIILGEQTSEKISEILTDSSIGLSTTPIALSGKSGSIAAMHAHGLPVICVTEPWQPRKVKMIESVPGIFEYSIGNFETCIENKNKSLPLLTTVKDITQQFIADLS